MDLVEGDSCSYPVLKFLSFPRLPLECMWWISVSSGTINRRNTTWVKRCCLIVGQADELEITNVSKWLWWKGGFLVLMHKFPFLLPHVHTPEESDLQINNDGGFEVLQIVCIYRCDSCEKLFTTRSMYNISHHKLSSSILPMHLYYRIHSGGKLACSLGLLLMTAFIVILAWRSR